MWCAWEVFNARTGFWVKDHQMIEYSIVSKH
jgi:hypothetical protein